jgi:hypothetical protein
VRDAARLLREAYQYPVDVAVLGSDLRLCAHASTDDLLTGKARLLPLLRGVLEAKSDVR